MKSDRLIKYLGLLLALCFFPGKIHAADAVVVKNVTVCLEDGRYGGWPANHGIWSWGNEILVGFELGYYKFSEERHAIDRSRFREHVLARSTDGGRTWFRVSFIGPEPGEDEFSIMPSTVRFSPAEILAAVRLRKSIDNYRSLDNGADWEYVGTPVPDTGRGNPPDLLQLEDGRLALVYGYRAEPYGISARLSEDRGKSWGEAIVLRDDGGNWDVGYCRSVQRKDGQVVSAYYFNDPSRGERYIAATIWDPGDFRP